MDDKKEDFIYKSKGLYIELNQINYDIKNYKFARNVSLVTCIIDFISVIFGIIISTFLAIVLVFALTEFSLITILASVTSFLFSCKLDKKNIKDYRESRKNYFTFKNEVLNNKKINTEEVNQNESNFK